MSAYVINGRAFAAELKDRLAAKLAGDGVRPGLATVLVGATYAAEVYERRVHRLADELGYHCTREALPGHAEEADVVAAVGKLNADPRVSGVLVLRPLPRHVSEAAVYRTLDPLKDIEAVHPVNAGLLALGRPRSKAESITPVPGGVGPVTGVWLLRNAAFAARLAVGRKHARPPEQDHAMVPEAMSAGYGVLMCCKLSTVRLSESKE